MVGGDTKQPDELAYRLKDILLKQITIIRCGGIRTSEEKENWWFLRSLNSPEYIANQFTRYAFNESSLFDALTVLEGLTVQDLQEVAGLLLSEEK